MGKLLSLSLLVALVAVGAWFYLETPAEGLGGEITVVVDEPMLEEALEPLALAMGGDMTAYRGHLYRVLTYALHFLEGKCFIFIISIIILFPDLRPPLPPNASHLHLHTHRLARHRNFNSNLCGISR
jgi:hypothetical protein